MNHTSICLVASAIVAAACLLAHGEGQTQNNEYEAPDKLRVAFVDVAQIFKRSTFFKAQMDEMKKKVDAAEEEIKAKQKQIADIQGEHRPDSAVELSSSDKVAQLNSLLSQAVSAQRTEFMQKENAIYYDLSQKIDKEIERCANRHGIQVVIRVSTDPVDPKDRNDVLRGINKSICYFDPRLNITDEVFAALNAVAP
jgi:Skp family chaperone for outer membrane proteins